ncbi:ATP-binding protein [Streptomyces dengpaensis]|uniref:ATP-binding protein n=1 Tax=Streptomyces dengpaensis TaxID=2049881 RepID=A0ABM6T2C0_9ACTN|nr:ATP-binding protein [Streptomyces dengpaensis]PIB02710.1 ATP-binding protein [Streptomyces sp. HG99]
MEYTLPRAAVSAGRARRLTSAFLTRPRPRMAPPTADQVDDATLIASELVANAVRHGRTGCRLRLQLGHGQLTVEVHDDSPGRPCVGLLDADSESGRGLAMVEQLAYSLEVVSAGFGGKTVRAVLTV